MLAAGTPDSWTLQAPSPNLIEKRTNHRTQRAAKRMRPSIEYRIATATSKSVMNVASVTIVRLR